MSDWDAVDGEVHAAGSAFGIGESHTARFVVLAGGVVGQVAELVRRSDETVDHEWVAGFRLQARRIGAFGVREGVDIGEETCDASTDDGVPGSGRCLLVVRRLGVSSRL